MKLKYRGIEYTPSISGCEMAENGAIGTYRGQKLKFHTPVVVPPQPSLTLQYRGIAYQTDQAGQVVVKPVEAPKAEATVPQEKFAFSSVAAKRHAVLEEAGRVHRENIYRHLVHRLEVARAKGDNVLIRQLEAEMHQFA